MIMGLRLCSSPKSMGWPTTPELRDKLALAIKLIINTQNREGGWRYQPVPQTRIFGDRQSSRCGRLATAACLSPRIPSTPASSTSRNVRTLTAAFATNWSVALPAFPRSAAALVSLYSAGVYEGRTIERGVKYLETYKPSGEVFRQESNYFYGHYYAAQAMWHAGGSTGMAGFQRSATNC